MSASGETLRIPSRCNGPLDSGNGGYSAGALAQHVDAAVVEVSLRRPVPLDVPLVVEVVSDGAGGGAVAVQMLDGDALVADARPADGAALALDLRAPPVTAAEARVASARYRGLADGPFCRCYVCGRLREDAFGKREAGAAVLTAGGELLALARALLIEPRPAS
ncbi:MAG TPA: hypothetical protein VK506_01290 [Conexibacter sp.]|nr:hypothetical protein [Conexibacter sp.]